MKVGNVQVAIMLGHTKQWYDPDYIGVLVSTQKSGFYVDGYLRGAELNLQLEDIMWDSMDWSELPDLHDSQKFAFEMFRAAERIPEGVRRKPHAVSVFWHPECSFPVGPIASTLREIDLLQLLAIAEDVSETDLLGIFERAYVAAIQATIKRADTGELREFWDKRAAAMRIAITSLKVMNPAAAVAD